MVVVLDVKALDVEVEVVTACARCLLVVLLRRLLSGYSFLFSFFFCL